MVALRLSKLEFVIMETLWTKGQASIRDMLGGFHGKKKPTYSTVQTMVYRLETKGALRRIRVSGNFHIFEPLITRAAAQRPVVDELLAILGGQCRPVVARLIESGKLTMEDVEFADKALKELKKGGKSK